MDTTSSDQLKRLHGCLNPYTVAVRVIETLQLLSWDIRHVVKRGSFIGDDMYDSTYIEFDTWLLQFASSLDNAKMIFSTLKQLVMEEVAYQHHIKLVKLIYANLNALATDGLSRDYEEQAAVAISLLND
jgi:hypothetical protein